MKPSEVPAFTVIISTYNRKDMLPRAVASVLGQTFRDYELLVIDNGSTDSTASVMADVADPRVKFMINPRPSGSCDAPRNMGISLAQGRYISFLDDDDIWYPERLEKVFRAFEEHPDSGAVCHNEYLDYKGRYKKLLKYGPWSEDFHDRLLYEGNCLSPGATTVKTELARRLGGFDLRKEFEAAADYDFWLRMAETGARIFFIDEPLGEFGFTGKNRSSADSAYQSRVASLVRYHILKTEGKPFLGLSRRGLTKIFKLYLSAAKAFLRAGRLFETAGYISRASSIVLIRPAVLRGLLKTSNKKEKE